MTGAPFLRRCGHAEWHGWTPIDLVFPWFLVIMGASLALGRPDRTSGVDIARRAVTLAALGLFMAGFPFFNPARWRIPGVLMRIALCYLSAAAIWRAVHGPDARRTRRRLASVAAALLLAYWGLIALVPRLGARPATSRRAATSGPGWIARCSADTSIGPTGIPRGGSARCPR